MSGKNVLNNGALNFNIDYLDKPTSVLGVKRLDIDDSFFLYVTKEIMLMRNLSSTFFVYSKDDLVKVYALAKSMKRRIIVLSPTLTPYSEQSVEDRAHVLDEYIDYKNYILNNYIVVVYSEYMEDKDNANSFISLVINNIERTLINLTKEDYTKHNMIFNDVQFYSDKISDLLYFSKDYNLNMLFMLKQFRDSIKEDSLKFIIGESINNIILPSAYIKDKREFLNKDCISFEDSNAYMVTGSEINLLNIDFNNEFKELNNSDSKTYKSMLKTFKNKVSKFEQNNEYKFLSNKQQDAEVSNSYIDLSVKTEILPNKDKCDSLLKNISNDSINNDYLYNNKQDIDRDGVNVDGNSNSNNDNVKESEDIENISNKENLISTLQNININRQELDLSFDDDDDYIFE